MLCTSTVCTTYRYTFIGADVACFFFVFFSLLVRVVAVVHASKALQREKKVSDRLRNLNK
jgi:hypothetical protein